MKVKSFSVGLANGMSEALNYLDKQVQELGKVNSISVTDTLYSGEIEKFFTGKNECPGPHLVRVVVYS
jgi:hypothetical protein